MSIDFTSETHRAVESLILDMFRTEPFHNLRLLYGEEVGALVPGGTCSDKTLSFIAAARQRGFDVALHSGAIDGEEKHRLARVHIGDRVFFADIGDGWPALRLYPADREIAFRCFGVGFRTAIEGARISVFCERLGRESKALEIDVRPRPEEDIRADIERRFCTGVRYPFSESLRFSQVVGERFLFLRGDRLEIHSEGPFEAIEGIVRAEIASIIHRYFGYDLRRWLV